MRLAVVFILALAAGPAFAQQAPQREIDPEFALPVPGQQFIDRSTPPPEGFYRDIPNAYDLLLRPPTLQEPLLVLSYTCQRPVRPTDGQFRAAYDETLAAYRKAMLDFGACLSAESKRLSQKLGREVRVMPGGISER